MKNILVALLLVLFVASLAFGQATGYGTSLKTGGTQGVKSGMINGMHDFTKDSSKQGFKGPSNSICGYCHAVHIPSNGVPTPLWARASVNGKTYGKYTSITLDASTVDPGQSGDDNYSSFCLSCHDGSIAPFAQSAYVKTPYNNNNAWDSSHTNGLAALKMDSLVSIVNGAYGDLSHTHPVNFTYDHALAVKDPGLYDPSTNGVNGGKYMYWDANYGSVGRLFDGKMQCSSCHNPHINSSGIMLEGSSNYGALCVACHKK
jgi:predicted CXXCH cytochrome family protein